MRSFRLLFSSLGIALASAVLAQQATFVNVAARGGSVAGRTGTNAYQGMTTVAGNATIALQNGAFSSGETGEGGSLPPPQQSFKFAGPTTSPTPNSYSNFSSNSFGTSATQGQSAVANSPTAPTYYTAGWGTKTASPASPTGPVSAAGGTYDPWEVTYDSVAALPGATAGSTVDLYYQSSLLAFDAFSGTTSVGAGSNGFANYVFQTFTEGGDEDNFLLQLDFATGLGLDTEFISSPSYSVYLLGANANDPSASPDLRTASGVLLTEATFDAAVRPFFKADGSLTQDLNFGIVRRLVVPGSSSDPSLPFSWHTETLAITQTQPVPEPSSIAALGFGALALLRRRKR